MRGGVVDRIAKWSQSEVRVRLVQHDVAYPVQTGLRLGNLHSTTFTESISAMESHHCCGHGAEPTDWIEVRGSRKRRASLAVTHVSGHTGRSLHGLAHSLVSTVGSSGTKSGHLHHNDSRIHLTKRLVTDSQSL